MKLITEMSYEFDIVEEDKGGGVHIVGIFSTAEIENNNGRKYKKELLEREVDKIAPKLDNKSLWGELGHPPNPEINLDKIAILTKELKWEKENLYGKSKVLDTPMGNIAKTLIKEGKIGISSRGLGTVGDDGYVNEDFKLLTYDLVTDPSNNPSWVKGIYEDKEFFVGKTEKEIDETLEAMQKFLKMSKESIFKYLNS